MRILALVKRVPATGGRIVLADDGRSIDTRFLGFVVSPHEECAVEEAVRLIEANGGESVVLTLGPAEAADQLRDALAIGIDRAVLLETDGADWDPMATSTALTDAVRRLEAADGPFDLILVGNESADSGGFQVGDPRRRRARPADGHRHQGARGARWRGDRPATGARRLRRLRAAAAGGRRRPRGDQPAALPVGPRPAPSQEEGDRADRTRLAAAGGPTLEQLKLPVEQEAHVEVLGHGPEAAPRVVEILREIGVL